MFPADNNFKFYQLRKQTGQGIIEIVVVLGLAAILILSLVALSVRSNRSANFSKAEDQAARLSQEWMEILRSARDRGSNAVLDSGGTAQDWGFLYTDLPTAQSAVISTCGTNSCLDVRTASQTVTVETRTFTSSVAFDDNPGANNPCNIHSNPDPDVGDWDEIKQFTVSVTWSDTSGDHTSTTSSCLRRGV